MHGAPCRFTDPARFSLAHGGKDRHPFPVPLKVFDETVKVVKSAVQKAKLGYDEELGALRRLDEQSRKLERYAKGPTVAISVPRLCYRRSSALPQRLRRRSRAAPLQRGPSSS